MSAEEDKKKFVKREAGINQASHCRPLPQLSSSWVERVAWWLPVVESVGSRPLV
jgi:hypothetical protein